MQKIIKRRLDLIPLWMKIFMWIFILLGSWVVIANILRIAGITLAPNSSTSLYGLETFEKNTLLYFFIAGLLVFKTAVSFAMLTEKSWAIRAAIVDAVIGILVMIWVMVIKPTYFSTTDEFEFAFQFEILLLVPYLLKSLKIRTEWEEFDINLILIPIKPSFSQQLPVEKEPFMAENIDFPIEEKVDETEIKVLDKEDPTRFMPK